MHCKRLDVLLRAFVLTQAIWQRFPCKKKRYFLKNYYLRKSRELFRKAADVLQIDVSKWIIVASNDINEESITQMI
jgi:hypothetical protein